MSLVRLVAYTCDRCDRSSEEYPNAFKACTALRKDGWVLGWGRQGEDLCPTCAAARERT